MKNFIRFSLIVSLFIGVSIVSYADVLSPTITTVYFEDGGVPITEEVEYEVTCYGYVEYPWAEETGEEVPEQEYGPVWSYEATCPEYGCEIYESYYLNYKVIDRCDIEGTYGDETFKIEDYASSPVPALCNSLQQFDMSTGENYYNFADGYHECLAETDYDFETCQDQYAVLIPPEDLRFDDEGRVLEDECFEYFDVSGAPKVFSDVSANHENYDAIKYVRNMSIVDGYSDGTYKPDQNINRAEFVKILVEAADSKGVFEYSNYDDQCNGTAPFGDVPLDEWYTKYLCYAKIHGIISGYNDGTFKPANPINFVEASKVILETLDYEVAVPIEGDQWYEPYVSAMEELTTIPDTIQDVGQLLTRGEMAELIYRVLLGLGI